MKTAFVSFLTVFAIAFSGKDPLTGRWQTKPSDKGNVTSVAFLEDNSFEGYINRKPFTTGKYEIRDGVFSFTDNGCDGKRGTYKMIFFSKSDSLRFEVISDSCTERKAGMERLIFGRIK